MTPEERHRAPALWLVALAIGTAAGVAALADARWAAAVLVVTLLGAAFGRVSRRGRRPEGIAVRAAWVDVLVLVLLAVGIALLSLSPGVADGPGTQDLGDETVDLGDVAELDDPRAADGGSAAGQGRSPSSEASATSSS